MGFIQCQKAWIVESTPILHMIGLVMSATCACLSLPTNLLLIYALRKKKQLSSFSNLFMAIMCCSDSCFNAVTQPLLIAYHVDGINRRENCLIQFLASLTAYFFCYFTYLMLVTITLDRYLHVTKLNNYNKYMSQTRALILITINIVLSACISFANAAKNSFLFETQVIITAFDATTISSVCVCYFVVLSRMKSKVSLMQKVTDGRSKEDMTRRTTAVSTVRALIVAVIVTYTPYHILALIRSYYVFYKEIYPGETIDRLTAFSIYPVYSFGIINAVIYGSGNKEVKRYVRELFTWNKNYERSSEFQ